MSTPKQTKDFLKKNFWLFIFVLYLATRLVGLICFGPHNDEVIYTQFAQEIHKNWSQNWNISIDGRMFGDYKDPLQYWLTAWSVDWFANPLWGVRLWSLALGWLGLYCLLRFTAELKNYKAAIIFAGLWLVSSYYFYFDSLGLAEVYVYGLSGAALYIFYKLCKATVSWRWLNWGLLTLILAAGFLVKQSMITVLPILAVVPFLLKNDSWSKKINHWAWLLSAWLAAQTLYLLILPGKYQTIKASGLALTANTFSVKELLNWPLGAWWANLSFYCQKILLGDYLMLAGLIIVLILFGLKPKIFKKSYWPLCLMWLVSFMPAVLLLRGQTTRHYGMFLFVAMILVAMAVHDLADNFFATKKLKLIFYGFWLVLAVVQFCKNWQPLIRFGATDMSVLEIGDSWASPLGINRLIDKLKTLPAGQLFYDSQWGNPGTAIQVFAKDYPQLKLSPITFKAINRLQQRQMELIKNKQPVYLVFDAGNNIDPYWVDLKNFILGDRFFCGRYQDIIKQYKNDVYKNTALLICYVGQAD